MIQPHGVELLLVLGVEAGTVVVLVLVVVVVGGTVVLAVDATVVVAGSVVVAAVVASVALVLASVVVTTRRLSAGRPTVLAPALVPETIASSPISAPAPAHSTRRVSTG